MATWAHGCGDCYELHIAILRNVSWQVARVGVTESDSNGTACITITAITITIAVLGVPKAGGGNMTRFSRCWC